MKYSLRSLMIVVTLLCVGLGAILGRIEYLRRMAVFHDNESARCASRLQEAFFNPGSVEFDADTQKMIFHEEYAKLFRDASSHPWRLVFAPERELRRESARRPDVVNRRTIELPRSKTPAPDPPKP